VFFLDQQSVAVSDEVSFLLKALQCKQTKASLIAWIKQANWIKLGQVTKPVGLLEKLCYPIYFALL